MQWTNVFKLPLPFAEAISEDLYYGKREEGLRKYCERQGLDLATVIHYSVGELIKSPRQVLLARRHSGSLIKDVSTEVYRILGTAIHLLLWSSAQRGNGRGGAYYTAEERLFWHFEVRGQTVVISGEPDLVSPEGVIDDYKVTAVWSWLRGVKEEWEKQLNCYAFLRYQVKQLDTTGLRICFVLRDWNLNETMQEGYPPAAGQVMDVPMWSRDQAEVFIRTRVNLHLAARHLDDDELPECSDQEMWAKEDAWAVIREGGKRAAKIFTPAGATPLQFPLQDEPGSGPDFEQESREDAALREARLDMVTRNDRLKKGEAPYVLEHRPGERTRCLRFCDAAGSCSQFSEYRSVAFRTEAKAEPEPA